MNCSTASPAPPQPPDPASIALASLPSPGVCTSRLSAAPPRCSIAISRAAANVLTITANAFEPPSRALLASRERTRRQLEEKLRFYDLRPRLRRDRERLNAASTRLETLAHIVLTRRRQRFATLTAKLEQLDPRLVLSRGYAIVLNEAGQIVKEAATTAEGSEIRLLFERDSLKARVTESPEP